MTAKEVSYRVAMWLLKRRRVPLLVPNTYLFRWESDLVGLNSRLLTFEVEIKVSRADLKRDLRPTSSVKLCRKMALEEGKVNRWRKSINIPSEFWIAVPEGLCEVGELPPHYGLLYISPKLYKDVEKSVTVVRKAKILHTQQLPPQQLMRFSRAASYRFVLSQASASQPQPPPQDPLPPSPLRTHRPQNSLTDCLGHALLSRT